MALQASDLQMGNKKSDPYYEEVQNAEGKNNT